MRLAMRTRPNAACLTSAGTLGAAGAGARGAARAWRRGHGSLIAAASPGVSVTADDNDTPAVLLDANPHRQARIHGFKLQKWAK